MVGTSTSETIDAGTRRQVVENIAGAFDKYYVFPEVARSIAEMLQASLAAGDYDALAAPEAFAERLTSDLQAVSHDKHIRVRYSRVARLYGGPEEEDSAVETEEAIALARSQNFGFYKVERLDGNIGQHYYDWRYKNAGRPAGMPAPPAAQAPGTQAVWAGVVGQTLDVTAFGDPMQVTVLGGEETKSITNSSTYNSATADGKFVVLFVKVTNKGRYINFLGENSTKLRDDKGREFRVAGFEGRYAAETYYKRPGAISGVRAGETVEQVLVYDVAADATGYLIVPTQ